MGKTIAISTQKGGCGKTNAAMSLGAGLARQGKRVLCLDLDPQHSLTVSFGISEPDKLPITLANMMENIVAEKDFDPTAGIIRHAEGVDLLPSNIRLSDLELTLAPIFGREMVLRQYIDMVKSQYDFVIADCPPSLGLLTVNALTAANSVIIPVTPKYLDAKGLELLLRTIVRIRKQLNPSLAIDGILLTMVERRTNFTRDIISMIENAYGNNINIFGEYIPRSVRAAETSAKGISIFTHDPNGKVAAAYDALVKGVLTDAA